MKPRIIISASLFALIVFLVLQFYTIINVYQVRSNDFDTRYNRVVHEAMDELNDYSSDYALDSMFYYMDQMGWYYKLLGETSLSAKISDSIKISIKNDVFHLMQALEPFSATISYKLNQANMDPNLKAGFIIHDFSLIDDLSLFPIIQNDTLLLETENSIALNLNLQGSLLDNFRAERDYFGINFDVYVDFTRKRQVIFGEMIGVLLFVTLSILLISFVFYITIKNLMKQKKISDLKSDFINNMTHELKTPLATISLASHGLSNDQLRKDEDKIKEFSEIINRQNKHLTRIIDQILDVSMWENQKIILNLKSVDFVQFVKDKIGSFQMVHEEIEFENSIPNAECFLNVDPFQLSIAINNLLDNAVKYKRDSLKLIMDLSIAKDEILLKICDNGMGISKLDQKNIFAKFYRVETASIHNVKGLGLGLFYVKSIVEAHGGEIWIESELNKGTSFFIKFKK